MAGSQFHNVSDVCTAMKQFSTQTSQSSAKGSFTTLDSLTTFSEALTCLCDEVMHLRAELEDLRSKGAKPDGAVPQPKSLTKKPAPRAAAKMARTRAKG